MSSHVSKELKKLLNILEDKGFRIEITKKCVKIIPPVNIKAEMYIAHYGEKGYHPVRRYIKNACAITI
jgi:hypothetical protein